MADKGQHCKRHDWGGDVYVSSRDAKVCGAQAAAFTDYPLVWAGPSVLGYPLVHCDHTLTKTRYAPDGRISHPGGDAWHFVYGDCTIAEGHDSCVNPIGVTIDPCSDNVDGHAIPKASQPLRSLNVRGARADVYADGILSFEQTPQQITIIASEGSGDARSKLAAAVAEALVPANDAAYGLLRGAPLTTAFAASPDTICRNSFMSGQEPSVTASPYSPATVLGLGIAIGAPSLSGARCWCP